jgi:hypothetical protein
MNTWCPALYKNRVKNLINQIKISFTPLTTVWIQLRHFHKTTTKENYTEIIRTEFHLNRTRNMAIGYNLYPSVQYDCHIAYRHKLTLVHNFSSRMYFLNFITIRSAKGSLME